MTPRYTEVLWPKVSIDLRGEGPDPSLPPAADAAAAPIRPVPRLRGSETGAAACGLVWAAT